MVLKILFNLILDTVYKCNRFSEIFLKIDLKFFLEKGAGFVTLKLGLILLLVETNFFFEEWSYKEKMFVILGFGSFKMVLALLEKVETFYMKVSNI